MLTMDFSWAVLGATVRGIDVRHVSQQDFATIVPAFGQRAALRFPKQHIDVGELRMPPTRPVGRPLRHTWRMRQCRTISRKIGSARVATRPPLACRRQTNSDAGVPPVGHLLFLTQPIAARKAPYCTPATRSGSTNGFGA
jgi:hypothetical protein